MFVLPAILAQIGPPVVSDTVTSVPTRVVTTVAATQPTSDTTTSLLLLLVLLVVAVGAGIFYLVSRGQQDKDREEKSLKYTLFLVRMPRTDESEIKVAEQMFAALIGIGKRKGWFDKLTKAREGISFEIIGLPEYIGFYVYVPTKWAKLVETQILGAYQGIEIVPMPEPNIFAKDSFVSCATFEMGSEPYAPIKTYQDYQEGERQVSDPLSSLTGALAGLKMGEGAAMQVIISPSEGNWQKSGQSYVQKIETNNSTPDKPKISVSQDKLQSITRKSSKPGFDVGIRLVASAPTKFESESILNTMISTFQQFTNPGINELKSKKITKPAQMKEFMYDFIYRRYPRGKVATLNVEELATIYHFPSKTVETPNIDKLISKKAPPPKDMPSNGLWLGTSIYRGQKKDIYIGLDDRRRHMYIIGQTGGGKSWMLENMIMQDIYAGKGLAFIDPHGSSATSILKRIPAHRAEDVIYFDPADEERPFGLNMIYHRTESEKYMVVNSFLGLMKKMFDPNDQGIVGPRFERAVRMAMLTVMADPKNTLVEVLRAIADENYARSFLPMIKDDELQRYYKVELAQTDKFHKSEILGWITSKFDRFITNRLVRNIIGQSDLSFDFRKVMDDGKILIINLSKGIIGEENASFLGLIMVPMILRAALSREDIPEDQRKDFFLYVDEFQNFATEEFAAILSEARKYRLSLITANQYISQMLDKVRDAVFGNVGTLTVLRTGAQDAEYLEKEFAPTITAEDLINLENMSAYVKTLVNGVRVPAFSMSTFYNRDKLYPKNERIEQLVRQLSRMKYGRDVRLVEEDIARRGAEVPMGGTAVNDMKPPPTIF